MNKIDIAIIGGGIAGLWILNRVKELGYSAILLESNELGSGQTNKSQGIIHGGMKYALSGAYTASAKAISTMPARWQDCLDGIGEIDLSNVPILSDKQYLWATGSITSKLAGIFANIALKSKITPLQKSNFPKIFQDKNFKGTISALNEIVIDVNKLIIELSNKYSECIFKTDDIIFNFEDQKLSSLKITNNNNTLEINAQKYIFTAGNGNNDFIKKLNINTIKMQQRPLHMVLVKHDINDPIYAHCLGLSNTPKITITTHKAIDGKTIWYLGGQIAEDGVLNTSNEQIKIAQNELQKLFSWLDFSSAKFASFLVNRAENFEGDGKKPDSYFMKNINNYIIAWPTKLAFAPALADAIIANLNIKPLNSNLKETTNWPKPKIAKPIWEDLL